MTEIPMKAIFLMDLILTWICLRKYGSVIEGTRRNLPDSGGISFIHCAFFLQKKSDTFISSEHKQSHIHLHNR